MNLRYIFMTIHQNLTNDNYFKINKQKTHYLDIILKKH